MMDCSDIVTLIAAILALAGSILSLFIGTRLAVLKERRQLLWSKELNRFFDLEELAGDLVEFMGSYQAIPDDRAELAEKLKSLEQAAGRFARYPEVRQSVRDLHNTLGRMFVAKRDKKDNEDDVRKELDPAYRKFLTACDKVLKRKSWRKCITGASGKLASLAAYVLKVRRYGSKESP